MEHLTVHDYRQALETIQGLHQYQDYNQLIHYIVRTLSDLIPADLSGYQNLDVSRGQIDYQESWVYPADFPFLPDVAERLAIGFQETPNLITHWANGHAHDPTRYIDMAPWSHWRKSPAFHEINLAHRMPYMMATLLQLEGPAHFALSLHRASSDFSEREKALLALLRPHFVSATLNALAVSHIQESLATLLSEETQGTVGLLLIQAQTGSIIWETDLAKRLLDRYAPHPDRERDRLPSVLWDWVREQDRLMSHPETATKASFSLTLNHQGPPLTIRMIRKDTHRVLVLKVKRQGYNWKALISYRITPREQEVLGWLLKGKSTPEISQIIGAKPSTIQKHLAALFDKFGVDHRMALVTNVLGLFRQVHWQEPAD
ncbi:MAG: helix-turn-helix transcriptional regulator [Nitrospira sp.]|nr:helix-turn-helix transcriptional regulator [Nitrospira sp.]